MNPHDPQIHFTRPRLTARRGECAEMPSADRPGPEQPLHLGPATQPRPAGTVIVLRGGDVALEVLLVRRNPNARFMGGAWVFPGGAVDADEGVEETALRELAEEAAIEVTDAGALTPFSRWITPAEVKIRFDTWFFVVEAPAGARP